MLPFFHVSLTFLFFLFVCLGIVDVFVLVARQLINLYHRRGSFVSSTASSLTKSQVMLEEEEPTKKRKGCCSWPYSGNISHQADNLIWKLHYMNCYHFNSCVLWGTNHQSYFKNFYYKMNTIMETKHVQWTTNYYVQQSVMQIMKWNKVWKYYDMQQNVIPFVTYNEW